MNRSLLYNKLQNYKILLLEARLIILRQAPKAGVSKILTTVSLDGFQEMRGFMIIKRLMLCKARSVH